MLIYQNKKKPIFKKWTYYFLKRLNYSEVLTVFLSFKVNISIIDPMKGR